MKHVIFLFFFVCSQVNSQPLISEKGHPEHVIAGAIIGGGTSYLVYRKTNNKFKAWLIGAATAATIGYIKEAVDPKWFNGVKSKKDFHYSVLGGVIGASIIIPLKRRSPKKTPNIDAVFRQTSNYTIKQLHD